MEHKKALPELSKDELTRVLADWGQPRYRADQVWRWLYAGLVPSIAEMRNLPAEVRARLAEQFVVSSVRPLRTQRSEDGGTEKVLLALADGQTIESVLMSYGDRQTVCVSSQVGCAVGCAFCATGVGGWNRNLTAGEIVEQVLFFARSLRVRGQVISNVVYMGMGEPFLNTEAVLASITRLNDPSGLNLGLRRVTISTVGIVPGIQRLARDGSPVGLAISLHAPSDELRDRLVPINRKYPLARLIEACREYVERTGRRVTFEYAMIADHNDALAQADELAGLLRGLLCHVNLIPVNPVPGLPYQPSPRERIIAFERRLRHLGVNATLRISRGTDIQAGCGQLRSAPSECHEVVNA